MTLPTLSCNLLLSGFVYFPKTEAMRILTTLIFLVLGSYLHGQTDLTPEAWQEDLRFLQKTVHEDYPFLFKKVDAETFNAEVEQLYKVIPDMQDHEVIVEMQAPRRFARAIDHIGVHGPDLTVGNQVLREHGVVGVDLMSGNILAKGREAGLPMGKLAPLPFLAERNLFG